MNVQIINIYEDNLEKDNLEKDNLEKENLIEDNLEYNLYSIDYIIFLLFLFLVGFNIFFIEETRKINKELYLIKNITNIPYDLFMYDTKYTIISLDVLFMLNVFILLFQVVLYKKYSIYCMSFFVILYFLIPSIQINYIIHTINFKKYINEYIKSYIISSIFYITSYVFYTFGLVVKFLSKKN